MNLYGYILGIGLGGYGAYLAWKRKSGVLTKDGKGVAKYLMTKGYDKAHASGIAGNLYVESKFDPLAVGDNGNSFGLAQWHKDRWVALNEFAKANKLDPNTFKGQLDFLDWELKNTEKSAYRKLLETRTPYDSAYVFAKHFERPQVISPERMSKAQEIHNEL